MRTDLEVFDFRLEPEGIDRIEHQTCREVGIQASVNGALAPDSAVKTDGVSCHTEFCGC